MAVPNDPDDERLEAARQTLATLIGRTDPPHSP